MTAATASRSQVDSFEVGWLFVQEYYTFLNRDPSRLHCFYNKKSSFIHGHEGEEVKAAHGQQEIHERIKEINFQDCKVLVSNVDSQPSLEGSILVQVLGEMSNNGGPSHKFSQSFVLAEQPNGYYVRNDIFRFLKEDIDSEFEEAEDPVGEVDNEPELDQEVAAEEPAGQDETVEPAAEPESAVDVPEEAAAEEEEEIQTREIEEESVPAGGEQPEEAPVEEEEAVEEEIIVADDSAPEPEVAAPVPEPEPIKSAWNAVPKPQVAPIELPPEPKKAGGKKQHQQQQQQQQHQQQHAEAAPAAAQPALPKTWAGLAATNVNRWTDAEVSPVVGKVASVSKAPNSSQSHRKNEGQRSAASQNTAGQSSTNAAAARETDADKNADAQNQGQAFQPVQSRRGGNDNRRQQRTQDIERHSIFLKGLSETTDNKALREFFSKHGQVKDVKVLPGKNMAFVEFATIEEASALIGKTVTVGGANVLCEERRKTGGRGPRDSSSGNARNGHFNRNNRENGGQYPGRSSSAGGSRGRRNHDGPAQEGKARNTSKPAAAKE